MERLKTPTEKMEEFEEFRRRNEEREEQLKQYQEQLKNQEIMTGFCHITRLINECTKMPIELLPYSEDEILRKVHNYVNNYGVESFNPWLNPNGYTIVKCDEVNGYDGHDYKITFYPETK